MWNSGMATMPTDSSSKPQCPPTESSAREVVVREQHALGPPRRARGVELQDGVVVGRVGGGLGPLGEPVHPALVVLADHEDPPAGALELLAQAREVRAEDDEPGLRRRR